MLAEKEPERTPPAPAPAPRVTDNRAESHVIDLVSAPVKSSPFEDGPSNERKAGANGSSRDLVSAPVKSTPFEDGPSKERKAGAIGSFRDTMQQRADGKAHPIASSPVELNTGEARAVPQAKDSLVSQHV